MYEIMDMIEEMFDIAADYAPAVAIGAVSLVATLCYFLSR